MVGDVFRGITEVLPLMSTSRYQSNNAVYINSIFLYDNITKGPIIEIDSGISSMA